MFDLQTQQPSILHTHDKPVKCVAFVVVNGQQVLVSAGWDKQLRVSWLAARAEVFPSGL
jgi:mRNA export factor